MPDSHNFGLTWILFIPFLLNLAPPNTFTFPLQVWKFLSFQWVKKETGSCLIKQIRRSTKNSNTQQYFVLQWFTGSYREKFLRLVTFKSPIQVSPYISSISRLFMIVHYGTLCRRVINPTIVGLFEIKLVAAGISNPLPNS